MTHSNESAENYLETILMLSQKLPVVRSVDIANELGYKKSSISIAMKNLKAKNQITVTDAGFIYLTDEETTRYAAYRNFKKQKKNCPHERATNRHAVAEIIRQMEALSPHVKGNLFAAMKNIQSEYLP